MYTTNLPRIVGDILISYPCYDKLPLQLVFFNVGCGLGRIITYFCLHIACSIWFSQSKSKCYIYHVSMETHTNANLSIISFYDSMTTGIRLTFGGYQRSQSADTFGDHRPPTNSWESTWFPYRHYITKSNWLHIKAIMYITKNSQFPHLYILSL